MHLDAPAQAMKYVSKSAVHDATPGVAELPAQACGR
jgi:hypothetical protein